MWSIKAAGGGLTILFRSLRTGWRPRSIRLAEAGEQRMLARPIRPGVGEVHLLRAGHNSSPEALEGAGHLNGLAQDKE